MDGRIALFQNAPPLGRVHVCVGCTQLWQDYQLRWEPSEFGGITVIRVMASKVWKPDIVLFNKYYRRY